MSSVSSEGYLYFPKSWHILPNEWDPPEVFGKVEDFRSQTEMLKDLKSRLESAQAEYSRMEEEIDEYRASVAPIRKCPDEVLLMAFKEFTNSDPQTVAHLLRVCRKWHDLAVNAAPLWSHIKFTLGGVWDIKKQAAGVRKWIKACLQRSGSLPLHISMDLSMLQGETEQLVDRLAKGLMEAELPVDINEARGFLRSLDLQHVVNSRSICHPFYALEAIYILVGKKEPNMARWKTVEIIWPERGDLDANISKLLRWFSTKSHQYIDRPIRFEPITRFHGFKDLSSLERLKISGAVKDLGIFKLNNTSLKYLDLHANLEFDYQSFAISRFIHLEHLIIRRHIYGTPDMAPSGANIGLPLLKSLELHGYTHAGIMWDVPTLQSLKFVTSADELLRGLPHIPAKHICWDLIEATSSEADSSKREALRRIVIQYRRMESFKISASLKPHWVTIERELALEQETSYNLPSITYLEPISRHSDESSVDDIPMDLGVTGD